MSQETIRVDVLVLGGGAGGSAAAWQAAQEGATVLVAESSPWLGGMITAAGVSAFDGNKGTMASGFFRRLRDSIELHYGGAEAVRTGWVSDTCFEPHVGAEILAEMVAAGGVTVWHQSSLQEVLVEGRKVVGAIIQVGGRVVRVSAHVTIDATEYGDALAMAGVPFRLGRESRHDLGESCAPDKADLAVQDMTMVAILKKYEGEAPPVPRPEGYNPAEFDCSTSDICSTPDESLLNHALHNFESFITYGRLPRDKYMLNWPFHSNDSPDSIGVFGTPAERAQAIRRARHRTMCYVHYMQNELGHPEWGLATDEFPTPDHLPFIPYIRESRRGIGLRTMVVSDVVPPAGEARAPLQADAIAVGDYFLDHHHSTEHLPPDRRLGERYPANGPFQIPYACLVPKDFDGLLFAEKNISVSHIVNGCSRLQPVVVLTGQAVGAAAALCVKHCIQPREVNVRELQELLLDERVMIYPFTDFDHMHPHFVAVQRLCMKGLNDRPAAKTFEPDAPMTRAAASALAQRWASLADRAAGEAETLWREGITRAGFFAALDAITR